MKKFEVRLCQLSTWVKTLHANTEQEAAAKAEKQAFSWERSKWCHFVQDAAEPVVEEVVEDVEEMGV